ncbi:C39 family peptidase [Paenibacillus roseipurpureus]|uniref:C39 family peptidase n=1 Tax=Paenibacillus roseopurpureus TaxID=2918901 RepID=A0AA96LSM3_9BACL|nr:C39 family peptidase [Paenibacillus sp. MBLB1832]WNR46529.1 C39 family peptidase [Paenibacillus sp. MBLB1832]
MRIIWQGLKVTFGLFLVAGLTFASSVFAVLLYAKATGKEPAFFASNPVVLAADQPVATTKATVKPTPAPATPQIKKSAMLDVPLIEQLPELPAGCEITSLTMLLQYYGVNKSKMELVAEMPRDNTPASLNADGSIGYWGNPNTGFVGDVTRKLRGFGIYHAGLFPLLKQYVPTALDLTGKSFELYEKQIANGIPVIVWTTIDYNKPYKWVTWDTPIGPIQTTYSEHAVVLVGYDESNVYLNDPLSGTKQVKVSKAQFLDSWSEMGKQGLTYMNK